MDTKVKILVVDDEETLCEVLRFNLEEEGYSVDVAHSSEEVLAMSLSEYSLILLDIMMGDISGLQLASILKRNSSTKNIPIIFCTAKDQENDMIDGLDLGADDYITKPYSIRNVSARVRTVLRRTAGQSIVKGKALGFGGVSIDSERKSCTVDGVEVKMPRKEFEILLLLVSNPGRVFSREELIKSIWPDEVVVIDRVIDVNITRLRAKLGEYGKHIVTRSGYGYVFMG